MGVNIKTPPPQIKMRLVDWFEEDTQDVFYNFSLINILSQKYDIQYSDEPDYIICSCYDSNKLKYDCVRIYFPLENIRPDWNIVDYALHMDYADFEDRYIHIPSFYFTMSSKGLHNVIYNFSPSKLNKRNKFCGVLWSNGGDWYSHKEMFRNLFFDKLSQYKHIDSGGKYRNNIGGLIDEQYKTKGFLNNKIKWLQNYKFNICFENASYPGYLTEKLFDAYTAGCIPIYWGDTSLRVGLDDMKDGSYNPNDPESIDMRIPKISENLLDYKINPKAFINAHNFPNLDALVEEVKRIDNDDNAYEAMRREPLFLDDFNPREFYERRVLDFFDGIFSQGPKLALRRGDGQRMEWYRDGLLKFSTQYNENTLYLQNLNLSKKSIKVAIFANKISQKWKIIRDFMKH